MKTKTLVVGYVLTLAIFLFAKRHSDTAAQPSEFRAVVDLTHSMNRHSTASSSERDSSTRIDSPAHLSPRLWTVDQIPAERLIGPLVVLDVRASAAGNQDYRVSVEDIAQWEQVNGQIAPGAVVVAHTGWKAPSHSSEIAPVKSARALHFPGYSEEAAQFLVEGRQVLGLGIDTPSVDAGASKDLSVRKYTLARSVYHLDNVANLDRAPANNAIVVVAPEKLQGATTSPVRIMALLR